MANSVLCSLCQSCLMMCCLTTVQAAPLERIAFPYQNAADLRGFLNVLAAFRAACLAAACHA